MTDTANAPERIWPKEEISAGVFADVDPESVIKSQAAEIARLRSALADAQAIGFAVGVEAAARCVEEYQCSTCKTWFHPNDNPHDDEDCTGRASWGDRRADAETASAIRALTPPDATAAAARVLLGVWPTDASFRAAFDACAARYHGGDQMQDEMDRTRATVSAALRAISGDTP